MSIYEYRDGWRISVSGGTDPDTGKRVRITEIFTGTKTDAKKRERAIARALDTGEHISKSAKTLQDFVEREWWPGKTASIAPWTRDSYRRLLDKHILPAIGSRALQRITPGEISEIIAPLVKRGVLRTAEYLYVLLKMLFADAVELGERGRSPMHGIARPRPERQEHRSLTPADWQVIRAEIEGTEAQPVLTTLITTGLRRSEMCGLRWGDIDFDRSLMFVRRSYHVIRKKPVYREPKTARSRRVIALDSGTLAELGTLLGRAKRLAALTEKPFNVDGPVFTPNGVRPYSPDSINSMWSRVRERTGINVRLHDLRHTAATLMLAAGVPVGDVSDRLGHATPGFTLTVYRHAIPGAQEEAAARLAALLNGAKKEPLAHELAHGSIKGKEMVLAR